MERLRAYVRRTILAAAPDYLESGKAFRGEARKAAIRGAFRDATYGGTVSGWWHDLIYNVDVLRLANYYRRDIASAVRDYCSECGINFGEFADSDQEFTWADVLISTSQRYTMSDYDGSNGGANETECMALMWGLRFAVEYIAGAMESELES